MEPITELDLSWENEEPDFGIAESGVVCKNLEELAGKIAEVKDTVKKINLQNQPALCGDDSPALPEVLRECASLEELNLSYTDITEIPGFVFELPRLRSLSFNGCYELKRLPAAELLGVKNLEELRFAAPAGQQIPEEICGLKNLKTLDIGWNVEERGEAAKFTLPEGFGGLANMEELSLSILTFKPVEGVFVLPESIAALPLLRKFKFHGGGAIPQVEFDLATSAKILAACPALEHFALRGVNAGAGHGALSLLTRLKTLNLQHISVQGNPFKSIANLSRLEELEVYGSEFGINELPDIFADFPELRNLKVVGNFFQEIPPSVYCLKNLKLLELYGAGVKTLDGNIGRLENLMYLLVYDNRIETLPESLYTLKKLKCLDLAANNFSRKAIAEIKGKFKAAGKIPVKNMPFDQYDFDAFDRYTGEKIQFIADYQGRMQKTKLLRATPFAPDETGSRRLYNSYIKKCEAAIDESPWAIKFVDTRIGDYKYFQLCERAAKRSGHAIMAADAEKLGKRYFSLLRTAIINAENLCDNFKEIKESLLTDREYIELCILAALQNHYWEFPKKINVKRLSREAYFRICWAAILHSPLCIGGVNFDKIDEKETKELCALALRLGCRPDVIPENLRASLA